MPPTHSAKVCGAVDAERIRRDSKRRTPCIIAAAPCTVIVLPANFRACTPSDRHPRRDAGCTLEMGRSTRTVRAELVEALFFSPTGRAPVLFVFFLKTVISGLNVVLGAIVGRMSIIDRALDRLVEAAIRERAQAKADAERDDPVVKDRWFREYVRARDMMAWNVNTRRSHIADRIWKEEVGPLEARYPEFIAEYDRRSSEAGSL